MLQLWGRISSLNVRKVVWAAREAGIELPRIDAGREYGIVDEAEYRARNPNGLVPLLVDGELVLWESNVIVRYLAAKHAPEVLYPIELAARFDAERWMDWQQTTLNPAARGAFVQLIRTPAEQRDRAVIERSIEAAEPLFGMLDRHLAGTRYMSGPRFSMADIPIGCEVDRWFGLPVARPSWPNVERWFAEMVARPAAGGVLAQPLV